MYEAIEREVTKVRITDSSVLSLGSLSDFMLVDADQPTHPAHQ